jgi:UDP-N-acetyl-D-galactosamine dehydrogenase
MSDIRIAVIGLGYVGLPLAVAFAKKYPVTGFDIKKERIAELCKGNDVTYEVDHHELTSVLRCNPDGVAPLPGLFMTSEETDLARANYYIVTVPTPTDKHNRPVLLPLIKASETIGKVLNPGDIVIYESTVYPGVTEEECVPVLEQVSGLTFNRDFFAGYSPERINPGDKEHRITTIKKITSGSTSEAAIMVDNLYRSIISAGTHLASSIKVAEAAKVIENSQRDINIAFVNELAMIFNRMGIDTHEVLAAARTKWNFLPFSPGLVGGHCIGVDPYYLAQKAQEYGYHPEIILAGRRLNDNMGKYVASEVVKLMIAKEQKIKRANVLVLGITFKENCPDIRNTRVVDIVYELQQYGIIVDIHDPWAEPEEVMREYGLKSFSEFSGKEYDAVILAVAHDHYKTTDIRTIASCTAGILYDVKGILCREDVDGRL